MPQLEPFPSGVYAGLATDDLGHTDDRPPLVMLHGLTFDRRMWRPTLTELATIDPGRRILSLDLPGHGESPDSGPYTTMAVVERVHSAVSAAGLEAPVIVGHSAAAGTATIYATMHPSRGVIAVEGTLRVGAFASVAQSMEPMLRGAEFAEAWGRVAAYAFRLDEVSPEVRDFVLATSQPQQEIVLGFWQDLFERSPQELDAMVEMGAAALRASGIPFVAVVGAEPSPADAAWIRANLPDARSEVWPHSGHFPHLAHPRRFADLLAETGSWARPAMGVAPSGGRSEG